MRKIGDRNRRRRTNGLSGRPRRGNAGRRCASPALPAVRTGGRLLDRILDTPHLAHVVPRLQPDVLHRVIQTCGLEDCSELVALATPAQLASVFDLDLWRAGRPGLDEQLDADRFGVWLEVLMECGPGIAAEKIVGIDVELVIAALSQQVLVFDGAALSCSGDMDGCEVVESRRLRDGISCEIGGYLIEARRTAAWDAIVDLLLQLDAEHHGYFHRVMRGCRRLSNSTPEIDGLHDLLTDPEQDLFDVAFDRERRRERQGFVMPAHARAFLHMARQLPLGHDSMPAADPIGRAYFRAIERTPPADSDANPVFARLPAAAGAPPDPKDAANAIAAVADVLAEAGIITPPPRALLAGGQDNAPRFARLHAHLEVAAERDHAAHAMRAGELAYLANTILAGCSLQARPFTSREASDAVAAICNLGLENWPVHWLPQETRRASIAGTGTSLPADFLVGHGLVSVFQVGWTVLHHDVALYAAEQLLNVLADLRCLDGETQSGLEALRAEMTKHWRAGEPWRARDALDVIVILDMPAWAALAGLIEECPVKHAGIDASRGSRPRAVSASAFEFISENSQIASVRAFMQSLPDILRR
jgi:hypothetical protein